MTVLESAGYLHVQMNILPQSCNADKNSDKLIAESIDKSDENVEGLKSGHQSLQYKKIMKESEVKSCSALRSWRSG